MLAAASAAAPDSADSRMSAGQVPLSGRGERAGHSSSLLAASVVVPDSSGLGGKMDGAAAVGGGQGKSKMFRAYEKGAEYFTNLFPVWLTVFSLVALKDPTMFAWFTTE